MQDLFIDLKSNCNIVGIKRCHYQLLCPSDDMDDETREWNLALNQVMASSPDKKCLQVRPIRSFDVPIKRDTKPPTDYLSPLLALVNSLFNTPQRIDILLHEWINNRTPIVEFSNRIRWFMHSLISSPITFRIYDANTLVVIDCPEFHIHISMMDSGEKKLFDYLTKHWKDVFMEKSVFAQGTSASHVSFISCKYTDKVVAQISTEKICARLFALLLKQHRGTVEGMVGRQFLNTRLLLEKAVIEFEMKRKLATKLIQNVVRYGCLAIIDQAWNDKTQYLPPARYNLLELCNFN